MAARGPQRDGSVSRVCAAWVWAEPEVPSPSGATETTTEARGAGGRQEFGGSLEDPGGALPIIKEVDEERWYVMSLQQADRPCVHHGEGQGLRELVTMVGMRVPEA